MSNSKFHPKFYLGIDIGSLSCDAVLIDNDQKIIASSIVPTGANNKIAIKRAVKEVYDESKIDSNLVKATVSTGYGRKQVDNRIADITEITCHAKGIKKLLPDTKILIDIGGQDSKAILLDAKGKVTDFAMNDKCAAGTGRFLEAMARALQVEINELANLDENAKKNIILSSMCTVFAESEVVSLIAQGVKVNEIVRGLNRSIATRTLSLVKRISHNLKGLKISMSGGVAKNKGVVNALAVICECQILVPNSPDTVGAYGAALFAFERYKK